MATLGVKYWWLPSVLESLRSSLLKLRWIGESAIWTLKQEPHGRFLSSLFSPCCCWVFLMLIISSTKKGCGKQSHLLLALFIFFSLGPETVLVPPEIFPDCSVSFVFTCRFYYLNCWLTCFSVAYLCNWTQVCLCSYVLFLYLYLAVM